MIITDPMSKIKIKKYHGQIFGSERNIMSRWQSEKIIIQGYVSNILVGDNWNNLVVRISSSIIIIIMTMISRPVFVSIIYFDLNIKL